MFVCAVLGALSVVQLESCTPEQQAKTAKAENDLCKLREAEQSAEAIYPSIAPPHGSIRAEIETAEDAFCAARAQSSPPAGSQPLPSSTSL